MKYCSENVALCVKGCHLQTCPLDCEVCEARDWTCTHREGEAAQSLTQNHFHNEWSGFGLWLRISTSLPLDSRLFTYKTKMLNFNASKVPMNSRILGLPFCSLRIHKSLWGWSTITLVNLNMKLQVSISLSGPHPCSGLDHHPSFHHWDFSMQGINRGLISTCTLGLVSLEHSLLEPWYHTVMIPRSMERLPGGEPKHYGRPPRLCSQPTTSTKC